jgi:hypothetical protein
MDFFTLAEIDLLYKLSIGADVDRELREALSYACWLWSWINLDKFIAGLKRGYSQPERLTDIEKSIKTSIHLVDWNPEPCCVHASFCMVSIPFVTDVLFGRDVTFRKKKLKSGMESLEKALAISPSHAEARRLYDVTSRMLESLESGPQDSNKLDDDF